MTKLIISTLALSLAASSATAAPKVTALECRLDTPAKLSATITYRDTAGATYIYQGTFSDAAASTSLRDASGRVLATSQATTDGARPRVTLGSAWSADVGAQLRSVMASDRVQDGLGACTAPLQTDPFHHPWHQYFCPILVYVWDPDLVDMLCGFFPGPVW